MTEEINNININNNTDAGAEQSQPELTIQERLAIAGVRHRPLDGDHGEITRKLQEAGIRHRVVSDN